MRFYVSNPWLLYVWINILPFAISYDQLVNTTSTIVSSSSTYRYGSYTGFPDKTIDGNVDQVYTNCMHTDAGKSEAWLQIDLGGLYNLKSVKIWYRQDANKGKDQNTKRLKGFSIFASYEPVVTPYTVDKRYRCYKDPGNVALDTVLELSCIRLARYVTIYNDQKNDGNGVFLEICEVEIYGCPRNKYGEYCAPCGMCKYECNVFGQCNSCKDGYDPPLCQACIPGRYGKDCKEDCHCEKNVPCNQINGHCSGPCGPGYYLDKCPSNQLVRPGYTMANSSSVDYGGYPNKTVDGSIRQNHHTYCMHTASESKEAWLMIDLRKIYNISSVKFWYRNNSAAKTRRIQGYNMRLSNTTQSKSQKICFQDTGNKSLPSIIENKCKGEAQYVWIYTNKSLADGIILEICEVQVFGCSYQESSGPCVRCNQCRNECNDNGECDENGCMMNGYLPPFCKECKDGHFGNDCDHLCGHCANNVTCNSAIGSCPGNCAPGWKNTRGRKCNRECENGSFGLDCRYNCSGHCAGSKPCNKIDGTCEGGCEDGWIYPNCSKSCLDGSYGKNCSRRCGHCLNKVTCHHVTGYCPNELCEPGYKERGCKKECENGYFGNNCREACSGHCAGNVPCNKTDGTCPGVCADGWIKPRCNETCPNGFYGKNCTSPCGHCLNKRSCDHVTGHCPSELCDAGYKTAKCNQDCDDGSFGYKCSKTCSGHCAGNMTCNKTDGICPEGCADGWNNSRCNEKCNMGFYGKDCQEECGHCVRPEICHHVNGSCPGQCELGYQGDKCNRECDVNFYGKDCQGECGHCRGPETCHHINGSCPGQCKPGYQGDKCDFKCDNGTFGLRCNFTCAQGCLSVCNKINGTCDQCQYGFVGEFCNISVVDVQNEASMAAASGIGAFILILVITVIVLAVILARKAKQKKEGDIALKERKQASNTEENNIEDRLDKTENHTPVEENAEIEYIVTNNGQKKTLIRIADLGRIIKVFSMEENKKFTEEFKGIPYGEQQHIPCSLAKLQQNMPKNRYKTTFPYDHSRVVLNVSPDNDYINANYIKNVEGKRRYIATQGPRKNTVQDFWAMIWQENIRVIVMVTKLTEGSTIKCEQYWPGHGEQMTSGPFYLQLMSQKDYANYTQRDINITNKKTKAVKTVNQVQFTAWPDHGTPLPIELLVFYRHVMRFTRMYPECPLVVHCSAGIGRTGTFIALDALYKHGQKEGKIDMVEYVKIMREDRMNMIQNVGQYVFLYKALHEIFKTIGRLLNKEQFIQEVTSQLMSNKAVNASQFKKEFNELLSIKPVLDENETKNARQNIDLNMTRTVLPADSIRVLLTSYARGRGNYYNAVPISSYKLRDGLIAAQYPVEGAAVDLVRLLIDQECKIMISINQLSDIATSAEWMTNSAEKSVISPYKTMLGTGRSLSNKLKMTVLKMKHDKDSEWHTVKVLEILNWKLNEKLPADEGVLIELMNKVQEIIKDPDTKIIVLSRDGATGCGIFCAVYNAIQQLQQDNEVDMFTIVRQLQMRRPEMISSMSEYQCCCQVVANFFSAQKDDIYENAQGRQEVTKMEENIYANTSS